MCEQYPASIFKNKKLDARCKLDRVKKGCRSVVSIPIERPNFKRRVRSRSGLRAGVSRLQLGQITVHSKAVECCWLTHTSAGRAASLGFQQAYCLL